MTRRQQKSTKQERHYRGVAQLRLTGKYGAHIWDPKRKASIWIGRSFNTKVEAAKAFDSAAVKLHGSNAILNFPRHHEAGKKSSSKGSEILKSSCKKRKIEEKASSSVEKHYTGVSLLSTGKYVAKILAPKSKAVICLGPFNTDIEAAKAFDSAAVTLRGSRAVLNFPKHEAGNSSSKGSELFGSSRKKRKIEEKGSSVEKLYRAVCRRPSGKYREEIKSKGVRVWLGTFNTNIEAAKAYESAAIKFHGIRAALNFPLEDGKSNSIESESSESPCEERKTEETENTLDSPIDDDKVVEVESSCKKRKIEEMVNSVECSIEDVADEVMKNSFPESDAEAVIDQNDQGKGDENSNAVDQAPMLGHLSREQALALYLQVLRWDVQDSWVCNEGRVLF